MTYPLISCIMPTAGRPSFLARSVELFAAQHYPNCEMVIVYNRDSDLPVMSYPDNVRFVQSRSLIIGNKRNEACQHATGDIIVQWDDDDLYSTSRLTMQAQPILNGEAHITGLNNFVFYEAPTRECWKASPALFMEIYVGNVHGGSLMFVRDVWERHARYPNISMAEDAGFLRRALKQGAILKQVDGYDSFVYLRHTSNTWKFERDNFRRYPGWINTALPVWAAQYVLARRIETRYSRTGVSNAPFSTITPGFVTPL